MTTGSFYRKLFLMAGLCGSVLCSSPRTAEAQNGCASETYKVQGKPLKTYLYKPSGFNAQTPLVFIMTGTKRNANTYCKQWLKHARAKGFALLVPKFDTRQFPGSRTYHQGNVLNSAGGLNPESSWAYSAIDGLFQQFKTRHRSVLSHYSIYGHSAGAQFVHRLVMFKPQSPIKTAVAANAGYYTLPQNQPYPYGVQGIPFSNRAFLQPLLILLGEKDVDPHHRYLRKTLQAMEQGPHRLARGLNFFKRAKQEAKKAGISFRWRIQGVKGVGHSNSKMARAAVRYLP